MTSKSKEFYCLHSDICKTLANPKRQEILDCLRHGELTVRDLERRTGISQSNLSQHLALLKSKGVVTSRHEGTSVIYSILNPKIIQAFDLMSEVLRESIADRQQTIHETFKKSRSKSGAGSDTHHPPSPAAGQKK